MNTEEMCMMVAKRIQTGGEAIKKVDELEGLLRECMTKFEDYQINGYKSQPTNLMNRISEQLRFS